MEIKINLLPDYRKEEIAKANRLRRVVWSGMAMGTIFILFYSFLFGLVSILKVELDSASLSEGVSGGVEQLDKIKKFDDEFRETNSSSGQSLVLEKDQLHWTNLFMLLSDNFLDGITVTDLATNDYSVHLVGEAINRDILTDYKDKLAEEKCFTDINLPLSNLVSKENIVFQMDLKIDRECLRLHSQ